MDCSLPFEPYVATPFDHLIKDFFVSCFLSFPLNDPNAAVSALKDGIERLTVALPFLSGVRVPSSKLPDKRNVMEIRPSPDSLQWSPMLQIKHHFDTTLAATCSQSSGFDASWSSLPTIITDRPCPLIRFRAHVFPDGVLLCTTINHAAFDGTGLGNILKMLAECCCANSPTRLSVSLPTDYAREASSRQVMLESATLYSTPNLEAYGRMFQSNDIVPGLGKDITTRRLFFSASKIRALQDACNTASPYDQDPTLSKNDVLTALLAICINRARRHKQANSLTTTLGTPVNLRRKFSPSLSDSYLGNAIILLVIELDPPTVRSSPGCETTVLHTHLNELTSLALRIRRELILLNQENYTGGLMSYLREQSDWGTSCLRFTDITVSSLKHLDIDNLEFGPKIGRVASFDVQSGMNSGICDIMPTCGRIRAEDISGAGGMNLDESPWEVCVALDNLEWRSIMEDSLLLWALGKKDRV
ncbi:Transferase [Penicillium rubens]|jgi:fumigaclavine B O-acetyltransferase|nr:Transferase [Penicillium rubens]